MTSSIHSPAPGVWWLAPFVAATLGCFVTQTHAVDVLWIAATSNYNSPGNWLGSNLPAAAFDEIAVVNNGGTAQLAGFGAVSPGGLKIAAANGSSGTLEIRDGGSLSVVGSAPGFGQAAIGSASGGGRLRVFSGGRLAVAGPLSLAAHVGNRIELGDERAGAAALDVGAGTLAGTTIVYPTATLAATPSAVVGATGNVVLAPTSIYESRIGVSGAGKIAASGSLTLGGALVIAPVSGFAPAVGQSFDLFDATSVSGAFSAITLPTLDETLQWRTSQLAISGILSVGYAGDFDLDCDIDGHDFLVWQRGESSSALSPADLAAWTGTFGLGALAHASNAIPEPAAATWRVVVFVAMVRGQVRRRTC